MSYQVRAIALLSLILACAGCGPTIVQLHPVTGDTFGFKPPPSRPQPFGPFDLRLAPAKQFDSLVAAWRQRLAETPTPGGAIAVVLDGRLRFAAGVGTRELGHDEPVTPTTRFLTASISKMLIAATVMSLVERDGLVLSRPLTDYVPYFRRGPGYDASMVTLEMLLTHRGGIPDSVYCPDGATLRATIEAHANDPYWSPPGRLYNYSNAGYALLASVIEEKTQRPFEDVVTERILRPAGMTTALFTADAKDPSLARGHADGKVVWTHPVACAGSRAAGGVIASVTDFARFAEVLLAGGGNVLSAASVTAMSQGRALMERAPLKQYGYGLIEATHAGLRTVEHSGFAYGFTSLVRLIPERNFAVIAFTNGTTPPDAVVDAATSAFLGVPEHGGKRLPPPAADWPAYVGRYQDTTGALGNLRVFIDGDTLRAEQSGGEPRVFRHPAVRGTFVRDANGRVEYLVTRGGVARRLP